MKKRPKLIIYLTIESEKTVYKLIKDIALKK